MTSIRAVLVSILIVLVLLPYRASAADVAVFGIAPASGQTCLAPGYSTSIQFMLSSTSPNYENMTVGFTDVGWMSTESPITIIPEGQTPMLVTISPPDDTTPSNYTVHMLVCLDRPQEQMQLQVETCLKPTISIEVTERCRPQVPAEGSPLLAIAVFVVGVALLFCIFFAIRKR